MDRLAESEEWVDRWAERLAEGWVDGEGKGGV